MITEALPFHPLRPKVKDWPVIGDKLYDLWYSTSVHLEGTIVKYQDQLFSLGKKVGSGILSAVGGIIQIMIALIIAGFLYVCVRDMANSVEIYD